MALQDLFSKTAATNPAPFAGRDYNQMFQGGLDYFMNPNSQLRQQARLEGMNTAAERGGINSSIAAGASERAALGQAVPLAQGALSAQIAQEQPVLQNWIDSQNFGRELAAMPYQNSLAMLQSLNAASVADPQLFSPSVVSGMSNFFNQNMQDILKQYFGE